MKSRVLSVLIPVVLMLTLIGCQPAVNVDAEKKAVAEAIKNFYESAMKKDMDLLAQVWAGEPGIAIINTESGGEITGWENLKTWMKKYFDDTTFKMHSYEFKNQQIKISTDGTAAWFTQSADEKWELKGKVFQIRDERMTGVLEKRDGKWKLVQTHFSLAYPGENEQAQARQAIDAANNKLEEAVKKGDATAWAALYTEDATIMPFNMEAQKGRQAIEASCGADIKAGLKEVDLETAEIFVGRGFAYETGSYKTTIQPKGKAVQQDNGKYVTIWKKLDDGSWRLYLDIWNSNLPAK